MPWPKKQSFDDGESLILKKDEVVKVHLIDEEPELYYTHFIDGKSTKCSAPDCAHCLAGEKRNEKGSMMVKDIADGKEKKLKGSAALFLALKETLDMCGGKQGFVFSMKATGDKAQRRYHVVPLPIKGASVQASHAEPDESEPF